MYRNANQIKPLENFVIVTSPKQSILFKYSACSDHHSRGCECTCMSVLYMNYDVCIIIS